MSEVERSPACLSINHQRQWRTYLRVPIILATMQRMEWMFSAFFRWE